MKELINIAGRIPTTFSDYSDFTGKRISHTITVNGVDLTEELVGSCHVSNSGNDINKIEPKSLDKFCKGGEIIHVKISDTEHGEFEDFYSYPYEANIGNIKKNVEFVKLYELNGKVFPVLSQFNPNRIKTALYKIVQLKPFSEKKEMVDRKGIQVFVTDEFMFKNPQIKSFIVDF